MRPRTIVIAAAAGVVALTAAGVGVWFAVSTGTPETDWSEYPGSAFRDSSEVIDGRSLEHVAAAGDEFLVEYREALTDELGIEWTELSAGSVEHDVNGYGGTSMLFAYDGGTWRGEVNLDDPTARQRAQDLFEQLSGGADFYASNDLYEGAPDKAREIFGAELKVDQPLWSLRNSDDGLSLSAEVLDRSLITGEFDPGFEFGLPPELTGSLVIVVHASGYGLLAEDDVAEFVEQVAPWDEREKPDPGLG